MRPLRGSPTFLALAVLIFLGGCTTTMVETRDMIPDTALSKPKKILVHDFTAGPDDVRGDQGFFHHAAQESLGPDQEQERLELGREIADALAAALTEDIRNLGFDAVRATPTTSVTPDSVLIVGHFTNIDKGNLTRRIVIGLGAGRSSLDAVVKLLAPAGSGYRELLTIQAGVKSGRLPGVAFMAPAGLAAGAAVGTVAASNAAIGAAKTYRSASVRQARRMASEITSELSKYFEQQGWITSQATKQQAQDH